MVVIERYDFGEIVIDGKTYTRDLIVFWTGEVWPNWWRKEGHNVCIEDVSELLKRGDFEIVIFGTGAYGVCRVSEEVIDELKKRGVDIIVCNVIVIRIHKVDAIKVVADGITCNGIVD